jgi:predicted transcriptional regulator
VVTQSKPIVLFYSMESKSKKNSKKKAIELDSQEQLEKMGKRIKSLRIKAGYTSYEYFAYEHDIPRAQFGRYEKGQDLRVSSLIKVINAFGITIKEFFSEGFE